MGGSRTMEKRGHHICQVGAYSVRQKVIKAIEDKMKTKPGSTEVSIYKGKKKIEGDLTSVSVAAQKAIDMIRADGKDLSNISKKVIRKYSLTV